MSPVERAPRWSPRAKVIVATIVVLLVVAAAVVYLWTGDGISLDSGSKVGSYVTIFLLIALDGVMPIFPGETTLNAAATLAAHGKLDLVPIIVAGALGAIVGDSSLFWLARLYGARFEGQINRAKANKTVQQAFDFMDRSPAVLIIGGRYVPGMRFVVNGTMGLSRIEYRRFVGWSIISGVLWSAYTTLLAYAIGVALGEFPLASFVISGLVTTVAITIIFFTLRRQRRRARSEAPAPPDLV
ncbi:MAG TPA: VTT domain-containing protein [Nocardioides sp.]|uniref:DedA family protein n=1 Tax=uncultured Nocardioides sp. TaxID=198441 RepID=UPI00261516DF|nr:VTT domain-containing protein [uncultured Nocardioides sp.]HRD63226.1 VTT domain-containing protein [Nocardioides sp.]HRI97672.1 VTT domain-containing protein [Nocardioides sp.]HRK47134.1 VTT domain-containing protein [Nocardioides sp.]